MPIEFIPAAGACLVSKNVLSGAGRIKWMVREESRAAADNGWRIFSDIDTTEYLHDARQPRHHRLQHGVRARAGPHRHLEPPRRLRPADRRRGQRHRDRRHCHRAAGPRRPALRPRELRCRPTTSRATHRGQDQFLSFTGDRAAAARLRANLVR